MRGGNIYTAPLKRASLIESAGENPVAYTNISDVFHHCGSPFNRSLKLVAAIFLDFLQKICYNIYVR